MKIQDLAFLLIFTILLFFRERKVFTLAGIISLVMAIPLFYFHIFFTAERLTWYAAAFFLTDTLYLFNTAKNENRN